MASCLAVTFINVASDGITIGTTDSALDKRAVHRMIKPRSARGNADPYDSIATKQCGVTTDIGKVGVRPYAVSHEVEVWQYCNSKPFAYSYPGIQVEPGSAAFIERAEMAIC